MRHRGIEPRPFAWKAKILTIRPMALGSVSPEGSCIYLGQILEYKFLHSTICTREYSFILHSTFSFGIGERSFSRTKGKGITRALLHQPGIEPGAPRWQREILPLNHWCALLICDHSDE
jgi:hypothetical protein